MDKFYFINKLTITLTRRVYPWTIKYPNKDGVKKNILRIITGLSIRYQNPILAVKITCLYLPYYAQRVIYGPVCVK